MKKKVVLIIVGCVLLLAAIFSRSFFISEPRREDEKDNDRYSQAVPVEVISVDNKEIQLQIELSGRLYPEEQIEIFAEVNGVLLRTNPSFREGNQFNEGQIIINIDGREHQENLVSMRSNFLSSLTQLLPDIKLDFEKSYTQWVNYIEAFDPEQRLREMPEPKSAQEKYFLTGRNIYSQFHEIRQLEIRESKFQIRAPFTGTVTRSDINPGALVRSGQPLGQFSKLFSYEMLATVRVNHLPYFSIGDEVQLRSSSIAGQWKGTIDRISKRVDPATQMVNVYVRTTGENLRQGVFLEGHIYTEKVNNAITLPRNLILENDQVFIIRDSIAQLEQVDIVQFTGDSVVVQGLRDHEMVINERRSVEFQGTKVRPGNP